LSRDIQIGLLLNNITNLAAGNVLLIVAVKLWLNVSLKLSPLNGKLANTGFLLTVGVGVSGVLRHRFLLMKLSG
jgi:hypothetical protein